MASFTLPSLETQDISTGTFYAHIVDTIPGDSTISVSQLDISDAIGYAPVVLTGMTYSNVKWDFDDITFPSFYFNTIPVGVCICKRVGLANSSSDPVITFLDFVNILKQPLILTVGRYSIVLGFPDTGVIRFNQYYQYNSGAYVNNEPIPKGLIYLLGTRNDTQSFTNLRNNSVLMTSSGDPNTLNYPFDRVVNGDGTNGNIWFGMSFGSRRIRLGTIGIYSHANYTKGWRIFGSNTALDITTTSINNASLWTLLATTANLTVGMNLATSSDTNTYWKYLKFQSTYDTGFYLQEIEFYNSSMYSTDPNLMSTVIDSSFQTTIADNSGFGHTWTNTGAVIDGGSLYLNGSVTATLSQSTLFNLGNRNFSLSIDFKDIATPTNNSGIISWDGLYTPVWYGVKAGGFYTMNVGDASTFTYQSNDNIGTPSGTKFDTMTTTRSGNTFTTTVNNTIQTTITAISTVTVGNANGIRLGINDNALCNGYIRNFKLVT